MDTTLTRGDKKVVISDNGPTVLIGERINPTGKKRLAEALAAGEFDVAKEMAVSQIEAGADILDINVVTPGVDEIKVLPKVVEAVMDAVDAPLCIDINDPRALEEALKVYEGKPIINSVSGEESSMETILPLVKEFNGAVIGLTIDEKGIPKESDQRMAIAHRIVERAESYGIPREDIIIDPLALTVGSDSNAGVVTIDTIRKIKEQLGVNQTLGASNISFGLPNRILLNQAFLSIAITAGVTCPTVNAAHVCSTIRAVDLVHGKDRFAMRYIQNFRSK